MLLSILSQIVDPPKRQTASFGFHPCSYVIGFLCGHIIRL